MIRIPVLILLGTLLFAGVGYGIASEPPSSTHDSAPVTGEAFFAEDMLIDFPPILKRGTFLSAVAWLGKSSGARSGTSSTVDCEAGRWIVTHYSPDHWKCDSGGGCCCLD